MNSFQRAALAPVLVLAFIATPACADEGHEGHEHVQAEKLGTVHFPITGTPEQQKAFDRAVAFLHSFEYEEAETAFGTIANRDPRCTMALWGIAMCNYHPIWGPTTQADFERGRAAITGALLIGAKTGREQAYLDAIAAYYKEDSTMGFPARKAAYEEAMAAMHAKYPDDMEGTIFYALAILGNSPTTDKTYARQRKAAALLNSVLPKAPDHPGVAHYLIHSLDYPGLAKLALPAARVYAKIAPSAPHAQHMPSHIFTRLGYWDESIRSNLAAAKAAREQMARAHPGFTYFEELHAMDYLTYAYLQQGRFDKAADVGRSLVQVTKVNQETPSAAYAFAAIPARIALEEHRWKEAAALGSWPEWFHWSKFPWAEALTQTARGIGAAKSGNPGVASAALARLGQLHESLRGAEGYNWADQVEVQRREVRGWIARAEKRNDDAVRELRAAAALEDSIDKSPVTPGPMLPAREQLADLLLDLGRGTEAVTEYGEVLRSSPGRRNATLGLERAKRSKTPRGPSS